MNEVAYEQQAAIQMRRKAEKRIKGWVTGQCVYQRCPVGTTFMYINEHIDDLLPFQAPVRCPRCGHTLHWGGFTHDPRGV
jgi:hypothetical protein